MAIGDGRNPEGMIWNDAIGWHVPQPPAPFQRVPINVNALIDEVSDWGVKNMPLSGCDVLNMLVKHGVATAEQVQSAYNRAYARRGGDPGWAPPGEEMIYAQTPPEDQIDF